VLLAPSSGPYTTIALLGLRFYFFFPQVNHCVCSVSVQSPLLPLPPRPTSRSGSGCVLFLLFIQFSFLLPLRPFFQDLPCPVRARPQPLHFRSAPPRVDIQERVPGWNRRESSLRRAAAFLPFLSLDTRMFSLPLFLETA